MLKPSFAKLDILIADPSHHMTTVVGQMLRHLKVGNITEVQSSTAALTQLQARRFGAVLVDDDLTPVDGVELTRTLRSMAACDNCHVPVIMMSTAPDAARIAAARDAGITEFLRKPFAAQHLATRLESTLAAPREFIANEAYAGPDRRRKRLEPNGPERRSGS